MIRVSAGFHLGKVITKSSSGSGARAALASLGKAAGDPLPGSDDSSPKKKRKKKAVSHGDN